MNQFIKWIIFVSLIVAFPCFFYLVAIGGTTTVSALISIPLHSISENKSFSLSPLSIIFLIYIFFYSAVFYFFASFITKKLSGYGNIIKLGLASIITILVLSLSTIPIYDIHQGHPNHKNLFSHINSLNPSRGSEIVFSDEDKHKNEVAVSIISLEHAQEYMWTDKGGFKWDDAEEKWVPLSTQEPLNKPKGMQ